MKSASLVTRLHRPETRRFLTFVVTGGIAALVNILSRIGFDAMLRASGAGEFPAYAAAVVMAFPVAMTTAFVLAKLFVFSTSHRRLHVEYGRFALVNIAALVQVWLVSVLLAQVLFPWLGFVWHAETIAHTIGVLSPIFVSYQGHKRFSFG